MRIYLAGPINGCTDDEANNWRDIAIAELTKAGHVPVDPMVRDYRGREDESVNEIVENDKADIDSCDVVIANCWQVSAGTSMEVLYSWESHTPAILVVPPGSRVSPWYRYHAHSIETSLQDALSAALAIVPEVV